MYSMWTPASAAQSEVRDPERLSLQVSPSISPKGLLCNWRRNPKLQFEKGKQKRGKNNEQKHEKTQWEHTI